jgi:hypothetical protein
VAELGIVGRVRKERNVGGIRDVAAYTKYFQVDFEYFAKDRLAITDTDDCAVHPMFYDKLNVGIDRRTIVYPFPDHPEYAEVFE